ncbi:MAG: hypothetical protein V4617_17810 [Gemmatimonadota bacterium]
MSDTWTTAARRGVQAAIVGAAFLASAGAGAQTTRDSAGVRIVENARPLSTASDPLHLSPAPLLVLGRQEGPEYKFSRIRGVMRLADGRIMVADGGSLQLRFYDANGKFVKATAGKGTTPGLLSGMNFVRRLRGDTIAVGTGFADVALYTTEGSHARTLSLPRADRVGPPGLLLLDMLPNGNRLAVSFPNPAPRPPGTQWLDSISFLLLDSANVTVRDLGRLPHVTLAQENAKDYTQPWLSSIAVVVGNADHLYYGFGDRYAIQVYSPTGSLQSIIRRAWTPTPVTPADWEHWVVEWSKLWVKSTGDSAKQEIQKVRDDPYAFTMPAFSQFIPDRVGRLWVREAHYQDAIAAGSLTDPPAVPSTWSVFDGDGRWLSDVAMPAHFQPYEIGADYVAGKLYGDDKVATVVIYPLISPRRR